MEHWTDFLTFALCHAEAMKYTQVQIDPMALMAAMSQARAQAMQAQQVIAPGFDPRALKLAR